MIYYVLLNSEKILNDEKISFLDLPGEKYSRNFFIVSSQIEKYKLRKAFTLLPPLLWKELLSECHPNLFNP